MSKAGACRIAKLVHDGSRQEYQCFLLTDELPEILNSAVLALVLLCSL